VSVRRAGHLAAAARPAGGRSGRPVIWDEAQLVEMTDGSMARVLGPEYARADVHPIRARMPSPPFLFVSRITGLDARRGALRPCAIEMEYDIPDEPWYALNGEIPVPILWESTHCMIFLLSYLGVDEQFDYELRYRVTDSTTRFCSDYVFRPGDTFRNDIRIKSFIRSRDKLLVFYEIDTFHGDRLFMRIEGAGGMFSDQDLASSKGYLGPKPKRPAAARPQPFTPLLRCERTAFGAAELQHLKRGRPEDCFGPAYRDETGFARRLCCEEVDMLDRVTRIEPGGGYHGLGLVEGEKDVPGDHWAFAAHFKNDPVLPGTLMMEGCTQLLLFYCHYLGMLAGKDGARTPRPLTDQTTTTTFRGQVERRASTLRYVVHVKEIVLAPSYRIVADIEVFHEGRNIIFTKNHGFALT